ncbi:unnamed protein product [Ascophyllum nodosum]
MVQGRCFIFLILRYCSLLDAGGASQAPTSRDLIFDTALAAGPTPDHRVHLVGMSTPRNGGEPVTPPFKNLLNAEAVTRNREAEPVPREKAPPAVSCVEATTTRGLIPAKGPRHTHQAGTETSSAAEGSFKNSEVGQVDGKVARAGTSKRRNYLVWDDYFMSVAFLSAMRSKDPSTQVGACIVNQDKRIVGIGYNGFPMGCSDDELPWAREADSEMDTKYPYVCHAEMNAILNKNSADVKDCVIYVALFPCNECAKLIIQSGIREVVYLSDKYHDTISMRASRRLFEMAGVRHRQHIPKDERIVIDFSASPVR